MLDWNEAICRYFLLVTSPFGSIYLKDAVRHFMVLDVESDVTYLSLSYQGSKPFLSTSKDTLTLLCCVQNAFVESNLESISNPPDVCV